MPLEKRKSTRYYYPNPALEEPRYLIYRGKTYDGDCLVRAVSRLYTCWLVGRYPTATLIIQSKRE